MEGYQNYGNDVVWNLSLPLVETVESNIETAILSLCPLTAMKFLGILRVSALCLLVSAFYGQPASCGFFNKIRSSKKSSSDKVSDSIDNIEEIHVESELIEDSHQTFSNGTFSGSLDNMEESLVEIQVENDTESKSIIKGHEISDIPEEITVESSSASSVSASQPDLVFQSSTWDDSHLASAVLFLEEFCREVMRDKITKTLSNKDHGDLCWACGFISSYMVSLRHRFMPTYGPGKLSERKEIPKNLYEGILKPEEFELYAEWVVKYIPEIKKLMINMFNGSAKLTKEQLKTDTTVGPLKYGFVLKDGWKDKLYLLDTPQCSSRKFLVSLDELQEYLDDILKSSRHIVNKGEKGNKKGILETLFGNIL
ncbi:secreted antigen 1 [Babesia divergens]|uniref:Secreted antigen 1 n=1 Tax=Babesia divergens TaxID=32595 RepID=A0AAD9G795_BABDI|nr:secreted antigen 1 [Babesia divergens]